MSLFGHLALRFGSHPENLATEALGFILKQSAVARGAAGELFRSLGATNPGDLAYSTQVAGEDEARPDLVARDSLGREPVLIEAKFWAGLTKNQPVAYLNRLPAGGLLVVVAPAKRLPILWGELRRRCVDEHVTFEEASPAPSKDRTARVGDRHLALISWRRLLAAIRAAAEGAAEPGTAQDVAQLEGLCERMDAEEFLPVASEELSHALFGRIIQFGQIVDTATGVLVERGVATTKGARSAGGNGYYGRYFTLHGVGVFLICDVRKWMKYAATPLWLSVYGAKWRGSDPEAAHRAVASLAARQPGKVFKANDGFPSVAIFVPAGVERDVVIARVLEQVEEVGAIIAPALGGPPVAEPPADDAVT